MQITTGRYIIELRELGWWDKEGLKADMMSAAKINGRDIAGFDGAKFMDVRMRTMEKSIVSIKEGDTVIPFSEKWVRGLTDEEGSALSDGIESMDKKK